MTNRIFFLGAGFSMAMSEKGVTHKIKYPSLKSLTHKILGTFSKSSLGVHLEEISPKYKDNIEELLTYLSTDLPWQNVQMKHLDKALYFELVNKIADYFNRLERDCRFNFEEYGTLAKFITCNEVPIITLNYDTLLEKFLISQSSIKDSTPYTLFYKQVITDLKTRIPATSLSAFTYGDMSTHQKLPVIHKLHGSINWLWSATNPSEPIYYYNPNNSPEQYELRKDLSEYIVPPVLDKTNFYSHNVIKSIWSDSYSAIAHADEIYIIGFSFPVTDLSVKFLFNSALSSNPKHRTIYAINTKNSVQKGMEDYIVDRYNNIFGVNNVNVCYKYCCDNSLGEFIKDIIEPMIPSKL